MTIRLFVDSREASVIAILRDLCAFETQNLDVGDFIICENDPTHPFIIIERKTLDDLKSSIFDGRYREQKQRLMAMRNETNCHISYIIEGKCEKKEKNIEGAIVNMSLRDNVKIFETPSVEETANFVASLCKRFSEDPSKFLNKNSNICPYIPNTVKTKKSSNLDKKMCFMLQLCTIPGISEKKAKNIIDGLSVADMNQLFEKLNENPDALKKVDGLGKVLIHNVKYYLGL